MSRDDEIAKRRALEDAERKIEQDAKRLADALRGKKPPEPPAQPGPKVTIEFPK